MVTFLEMSEQERIEALTSRANNFFGKVLTLFAMESGKSYTIMGLAERSESFLGESLPFTVNGPYGYCRLSLAPIGFVEAVEPQDGAKKTAFARTEDAEKYGLPSAMKFLRLADAVNLPLNLINGGAGAGGEMRRGYVTARLLEKLSDKRVHSEIQLSEALSLSPATVANGLVALRSVGFIRFDSIATDPFGASERGYAVAMLRDKGRLKEYAADNAKLRLEVAKIRPHFHSWGYLNSTLNLGEVKIERNYLTKTLGIESISASTVVSILCDLGIYEYDRFKGRTTQSRAIVTKKGSMAFNLAYEPVLRVAREPRAAYVTTGFRKQLDGTEKVELVQLLKREKRRYTKVKKTRTPEDGARVRTALLSVFRKPEKEYRLREIAALSGVSVASTYRALVYLRREGAVVQPEVGFYRLAVKA